VKSGFDLLPIRKVFVVQQRLTAVI